MLFSFLAISKEFKPFAVNGSELIDEAIDKRIDNCSIICFFSNQIIA